MRATGLGWTCSSAAALTLSLAAATAAGADRPVSYSRDVKPILSSNCYACHGPDENRRKAGLRFDVREVAVGELPTGGQAIVPGDTSKSLLIERITSTDDDERMPPIRTGKKLTGEQIELLRKWIEQGARFDAHWSYVPPVRPATPEVKDKTWPVNAVDSFVLARLEEEKLAPSPEADRRTLIRRLSFDLVGLPPSPEEVDAFVRDPAPQAYERLVDRLLASPHYGERMAMYWLDLVRYGDSKGYHSDNPISVWPYRDYVIAAFNDNKPYDVFTVEQLAGDLVATPTDETRIASGYNRLNLHTEEGGAQPKEYIARYMADRVRTTSAVWMGASLGCAECHDHKFDPYTSRDFYSFGAFFADLEEEAVKPQIPRLTLPTGPQRATLQRLDGLIARLHQTLDPQMPKADPPQDIKAILAIGAGQRTPEQQKTLSAYYDRVVPALKPLRERLTELEKERDQVQASVPTMLVSTAVKPRPIRILPRGNWMDDSGPIVTPSVPGFLAPGLNVQGRRPSRLDLARWLTDPRHPLTARVFVNRLWKIAYGQGIARTLDDFGSQSAWPTHPGLLDWLAVEFVDSGWDVKHMVRLMVLSRAYRQVSAVSPELHERDPGNSLLARQGRFRLDAEMIRDNALAISGLLSDRIGGPSVKPYQPAGYWSFLNFPPREYVADDGESQYRRGLYTWWQRTFLHPALAAFDAPSREACTAERPRSNTPLQALVLLNDPSQVETARVFATLMIREGGPDASHRLKLAFRRALNRDPQPAEAQILMELCARHMREYAADKTAAAALLKVGEMPAPANADPVELAAWTSVARAILNLHETITRDQMSITHLTDYPLSRRAFLGRTAGGLGAMALASLLNPRTVTAAEEAARASRGIINPLHFAPRARRVIWLYMAGGPSHLETFDEKPKLAQMHGQPMPDSFTAGQPIAQLQGQKLNCFAPQFKFNRCGASGQSICEVFPYLAKVADELCIIRSMRTDAINHDPAHTFMNTGTTLSGRPSMGSWVLYGLGSESENLPGFVVLTSTGKGGQMQPISARQWHSGFLPGRYQGVQFRSQGDAVLYVNSPAGVTPGRQREVIDAVNALNKVHAQAVDDPEIATRITQYEMAFKMQTSVPDLMDLSKEPESVKKLYGTQGGDGSFAANCLLARRLAERGVRFIQCYHRDWDHHGAVKHNIEVTAREVDQGMTALIQDLKARDMLKDTLVIWGGEFGRTPMAQGDGRDHHMKGFSMWLAGAGVKPGFAYGETDELGYNAARDVVHVHDLHATALYLLGIDHQRLTYRWQGRDFRLTDVAGKAVKDILT